MDPSLKGQFSSLWSSRHVSKDAERVSKANAIYKHRAQFGMRLDDLNIAWTIENSHKQLGVDAAVHAVLVNKILLQNLLMGLW